MNNSSLTHQRWPQITWYLPCVGAVWRSWDCDVYTSVCCFVWIMTWTMMLQIVKFLVPSLTLGPNPLKECNITHLAKLWELPWVGPLSYTVIAAAGTCAPSPSDWGRKVGADSPWVTLGQTLCLGTSGREPPSILQHPCEGVIPLISKETGVHWQVRSLAKATELERQGQDEDSDVHSYSPSICRHTAVQSKEGWGWGKSPVFVSECANSRCPMNTYCINTFSSSHFMGVLIHKTSDVQGCHLFSKVPILNSILHTKNTIGLVNNVDLRK